MNRATWQKKNECDYKRFCEITPRITLMIVILEDPSKDFPAFVVLLINNFDFLRKRKCDLEIEANSSEFYRLKELKKVKEKKRKGESVCVREREKGEKEMIEDRTCDYRKCSFNL